MNKSSEKLPHIRGNMKATHVPWAGYMLRKDPKALNSHLWLTVKPCARGRKGKGRVVNFRPRDESVFQHRHSLKLQRLGILFVCLIQAFKKISIKSLADHKLTDQRRQWPHTTAKNSLNEQLRPVVSCNNKAWEKGRIRFPEVSQYDIQNTQFS